MVCLQCDSVFDTAAVESGYRLWHPFFPAYLCLQGYNATVLAYGQTGSGKTHTMSGGIGIHGKLEEGGWPSIPAFVSL